MPESSHAPRPVLVGRGPIVVAPDLVVALRRGAISGAALDVSDTEPLAADSPRWDAPLCVISAHMSGDLVAWWDTLARQLVHNAERWLAGARFATSSTSTAHVPRDT